MSQSAPASAAPGDVRDWVCANVDYDRKIAAPAHAMTPGVTDMVRDYLAQQPYHWQFMKSKRKELQANCMQYVRKHYQPPPEVVTAYPPTEKDRRAAARFAAENPGGPPQFMILGFILSAIISTVVSKVFAWLWDKWFSHNDTAHSQLVLAGGFFPPPVGSAGPDADDAADQPDIGS